MTLNAFAGTLDHDNPSGRVNAATRGIDITPDEESRSIIREVDGYAYLGEDTTPKMTRQGAFADARRQALESAYTTIQSKTKVDMGELKIDVIESQAEGAVTVLEQKDHGLTSDGRYHVWIRAEVKYELPTIQPISQTLASSGAPLTVRAWTDKKRFQKGEYIVIHLEGNRDFHARIVDFMSDGTTIQLLPNRYRPDTFFKGGTVYQIPDKSRGDRFNLKVSPPFGTDKIVVYASEQPVGEISLSSVMSSGLGLVSGSAKDMAGQVRGIQIEGEAEASAEFYESTWKIETSQ